ncbi:hypothetical protein TanjilG_23929 [Lupinus angustifolius]|uniref:Uncharacterized protein n=1 Tax=Lupinus angustifolius TaxID=3871 RepID=A0A1J7HKF4_LUPAN|nr:PREDICTED: uncharacterized protein LOC109360565 [Lupinus angustifolius]OIW02221.1 hypothetical protein TanjilG_23929 [Lupinus angustifolius]
MDPSRDLASEGEFNGSESGWTTYIGSHNYNEDEQSVDVDEYGYNYKNGHGKVDNYDDNKGTGDEESDDDSMASDASSGPSHFQLVCINSERKHTENDNEKILSAKQTNKEVTMKTRYEGMVEKEEEDSLQLIADSVCSHA